MVVFPPHEVFRVLYKGALIAAMPQRAVAFPTATGEEEVVLRSGFLRLVRQHFESLVAQMAAGVTAASVHRATLVRFRSTWRELQSHSTCLSCLRRRPEFELPCDHAVCENCVAVFGQRGPAMTGPESCTVRLAACLLCGTALSDADAAAVIFRLHPPTAGVGVLCIDGGGVRGIVPLQLMKRIEGRIGLPLPLQRFIRVAFGVSSGGLIAADLFINGHTVDQTLGRFVALARRVFQPRAAQHLARLPHTVRLLLPHVLRGLSPLDVVARIASLLVAYLADGIYRPEGLEAALKEAFGTHRSLLAVSHATANGTRIGLPVATVHDKPVCKVFTNYNGVGARHDMPGLFFPLRLFRRYPPLTDNTA